MAAASGSAELSSTYFLADVGPLRCRLPIVEASDRIQRIAIEPMEDPPKIGPEFRDVLESDWDATPEQIEEIIRVTLAQIVRYPGTRPALTFIGYVPYDGGPFLRDSTCPRFDA